MTDQEIPTKQFKISGKTGTFSVDKKPQKMVDGEMKYQGFWNNGIRGHSFGYGFSRAEALYNTIKNFGRI